MNTRPFISDPSDSRVQSFATSELRASNHSTKSALANAFEQDGIVRIRRFFDANALHELASESDEIDTSLPVKAGDALFFHGCFVHCSPENRSHRSTKALSFQFIETDQTEFSSFNWIQSPNKNWIY